jgi:hypothetical protein
VLIDEAQDLFPPLIDALSGLASDDDLFGVFLDPEQTTRRELAGQPWQRPE